MSKTFRQSRRDKEYFDDYGYSEQEYKKKERKKERKLKYFDDYDSFESRQRYDNKPQKYRY